MKSILQELGQDPASYTMAFQNVYDTIQNYTTHKKPGKRISADANSKMTQRLEM